MVAGSGTRPCTPVSTQPTPTPIQTGWSPSTPSANWRPTASWGALHDTFYTTSGVDTPVATAAKFGQGIAAELLEAKIGAMILTGT